MCSKYSLHFLFMFLSFLNDSPKRSVFRHYCFQNVKDGIQIHVYNVINESAYYSSQFVSVKFKKNEENLGLNFGKS